MCVCVCICCGRVEILENELNGELCELYFSLFSSYPYVSKVTKPKAQAFFFFFPFFFSTQNDKGTNEIRGL